MHVAPGFKLGGPLELVSHYTNKTHKKKTQTRLISNKMQNTPDTCWLKVDLQGNYLNRPAERNHTL